MSVPEKTSSANTHHSSENADVCPRCKGAGYLRLDAPVDHPNFSRLIPCVCKRQERWERASTDLGEYSNMHLIMSWTFESFDSSIPGTETAYTVAREYAEDPYNWLMLVGPYGCGKTHLAAAIANYARQQLDMRPIFTVVPDLLDYLRSTFSPNADATYETRFEAIRAADLLILDDLGTENTTPWAREKLFQVVNHRYMERLPTVITTNVKLEKIEGRICSRLLDRNLSTLVEITADDYRTRGAAQSRSRHQRG